MLFSCSVLPIQPIQVVKPTAAAIFYVQAFSPSNVIDFPHDNTGIYAPLIVTQIGRGEEKQPKKGKFAMTLESDGGDLKELLNPKKLPIFYRTVKSERPEGVFSVHIRSFLLPVSLVASSTSITTTTSPSSVHFT